MNSKSNAAASLNHTRSVSKIMDQMEPSPMDTWRMLCTVASDQIRLGTLRELVREYSEKKERRWGEVLIHDIAHQLHDRLCMMGFRETLKIQAEVDRKTKSGELKRDIDKATQEAESDLKAAKTPPTAQQVKDMMDNMRSKPAKTYSYSGQNWG